MTNEQKLMTLIKKAIFSPPITKQQHEKADYN